MFAVMGFVVMFSGAHVLKYHMMLTRLETPFKVWSFLGKEGTLITGSGHGAQQPELGYLLQSFLHWYLTLLPYCFPPALVLLPEFPPADSASCLPQKVPVPVLSHNQQFSVSSQLCDSFSPAVPSSSSCSAPHTVPTPVSVPAPCPWSHTAREELCWPTSPPGCSALPRGQGPAVAQPACDAPEPAAGPAGTLGGSWWPSVTCSRGHWSALGTGSPGYSQLQPSQMRSLVCSSDLLSLWPCCWFRYWILFLPND